MAWPRRMARALERRGRGGRARSEARAGGAGALCGGRRRRQRLHGCRGERRARDVLARGCPLDLHPRVFGVGQCAQSHYFKASITLVPTGDDSYDIVVRRSFADYFCRIMLDAATPLA
ncbi:sarcosine oxidase gamma subunit [Burkholderia mallei GB8 horse 4]|nr:sarcosine oxidase gamma subunit [Burkholderia mallei GB8 horse 4]